VFLLLRSLDARVQVFEILFLVFVELGLAAIAAEIVARSLVVAIVRGFRVGLHALVAHRAEQQFLLGRDRIFLWLFVEGLLVVLFGEEVAHAVVIAVRFGLLRVEALGGDGIEQ